jgi:RHS repeat-associated protein
MRSPRYAGLALPLLLLASALPAAADAHTNTQGGVDVNQVFQVGSIDDINLFNGALTVAIPLGLSYPDGARMSYRLTLVASSNPWVFWSETTPTITYSESQPNQCSNAGFGWRVSFGAVAYGDVLASSPNAPSTPVCASPANGEPLAIYEGPDGAQHIFYATLHAGDPDDTFDGIQDNLVADVENVQYTRDGSYLRLIRYNAHTASESTTIEFPNGEIHSFDKAGQITQIKDRFNNQVNFAYLTTAAGGCPGATGSETSCWKISDTVGRTHWIYFRTDLPVYNGTGIYQGLISRVVLAGFSATQSTYTFNYVVSPTIGRGCPMTDPNFGDIQVPLLASVTLPDGSQYQPTASGYILQAAGAGKCVEGSGSLAHLTLPTQGTLDWTYQQYYFPSASSTPNQRPFHTQNPGILTRTTFDGANTATWTYSTTSNAPDGTTPFVMNQVTDPLGSRWQRYFSLSLANTFGPGPNAGDYGLQYNPTQTQSGNNPPTASDVFLSEQVFDALGNLRRTVYRRYERDVQQFGGTPPDVNDNDDRLAQEVTVYDDGTQSGYLDADFDGVGHYRYRQTSGTLPGNDLRIDRQQWNQARGTYSITQSTNTLATTYNYLPPTTPWVLTTKTFDSQGEGGVAQARSYCYDSNTGFLLRQRGYFSTAIPWNADPGGYTNAADALAVFTPDSLGDLGTEEYYGGDVNPVTPTSSDICQQTIPATPEYEIFHGYTYGSESARRYAPAGFYSLNLTIDASTGLAASSFDTAGIKTSYQYDALGRTTYVLPQNGAWTQYLYNSTANPVSVTEQKQQNGAPGTVLAQKKYLYDGWGRLKEMDVLMADCSTRAQSTTYNALGWKASETELGSLNQTSYSYGLQNVSGTPPDPFGRVGLLRYPDGHSVTTTYTGVQAVQRQTTVGTAWNGSTVTETPVTTTSTYDRFGRLASVVEPSGAAGAQVTTAYGYDPGDRLLSAATTAAGTTQNRAYVYDGRGLLRSETHPERTGAKTYSGYDSRGHLHRAQDGVNDLSYTYDGAERPLLVYNTANGANCATNPALSATCLKQFRYDGTSDSLGRLYQASRFNHMTLSGSPYGDEWTYTYTYQGLDGRLSQRDLQHTFCSTASCQATGAQETFTQSWVYTQLGDVGTENYPTCAAAFTSCAGVTGRAVQNTYSNGFLTGIAGYTGGAGITYYPNGMVSSVTAFNGVTTTYGADPSGLPRPSSITASGPGGTLWSSGTYTYDGAGNVTRVGQSYYTYDGVSRLVDAQVETNPLDGVGTTFATQSFSWDAFGNHTGMFGGIDQSANAANNHLTYGTYDAAGNLRTWSPPGLNAATYDFDELNNLKHYKNGGEEWLYMYDADDERIWSFQVAGAPTPPRFDRWTLRGLDGAVRRTFELSNYNWNATSPGWATTNSWEDDVYRGGVLLANYPNSAQRRTLSVDHLGSPRLITNGNGTETAFHAYLPFGEEATSISQDCAVPPCERTKFAGQERDLADPTTDRDDLDYLHARHYNPLTGRFLTLDSHAANRMLPQSWNRYGYTRGNPLRLVDRDGKEAITFQITTAIQAPAVFAPRLDWPPVAAYAGGMKTTQTFTVETDPKKSGDPVVAYDKIVGPTTRYNLDGVPVAHDTASADGIGLFAGRDSTGTAAVIAGAAVANPLEPNAPPIVYGFMVVPDQSGTSFNYSVYFGGFPTLDITATNEAGQTVTVYHSQEATGLFAPFILFCGELECGQSANGTVSFGIRH